MAFHLAQVTNSTTSPPPVSVPQEFMDTSGGAGNGHGAAAGVPVRRKSRKKAVDRRASKGRKIKYVTHPKMQNFMFPQVRCVLHTATLPVGSQTG